MTLFQPATPYSNSITRPPCSKCSTVMMLARIAPDAPDHDKRSFECPNCNHEETLVVKYR
jgi:DNA-directed RNA polymerase subunit RPC12/RpoP